MIHFAALILHLGIYGRFKKVLKVSKHESISVMFVMVSNSVFLSYWEKIPNTVLILLILSGLLVKKVALIGCSAQRISAREQRRK